MERSTNAKLIEQQNNGKWSVLTRHSHIYPIESVSYIIKTIFELQALSTALAFFRLRIRVLFSTQQQVLQKIFKQRDVITQLINNEYVGSSTFYFQRWEINSHNYYEIKVFICSVEMTAFFYRNITKSRLYYNVTKNRIILKQMNSELL